MERRPVKKQSNKNEAGMQKVISGLKNHKILILGELGILAVLCLLVAIVMWSLTLYTRHNKEIELPDFVGRPVAEAETMASASDVRIMVVDTVFNRFMPKGCVVRQTPSAHSMVKKNRTVRLTVNAMAPKNLPVPDVLDEPFKTAVSDLEKCGFEIGRLTFTADRASYRVLRISHKGRSLEPGALLPGGSLVDIQLGLSDDSDYVEVPDVVGMDYKTALRTIKAGMLNTASCVFDKNIKTYQDSVLARVYRQNPDCTYENAHPGKNVTIYLTLDESRIPEKQVVKEQE